MWRSFFLGSILQLMNYHRGVQGIIQMTSSPVAILIIPHLQCWQALTKSLSYSQNMRCVRAISDRSSAYAGSNRAFSTPNEHLYPRRLFYAFAWRIVSLRSILPSYHSSSSQYEFRRTSLYRGAVRVRSVDLPFFFWRTPPLMISCWELVYIWTQMYYPTLVSHSNWFINHDAFKCTNFVILFWLWSINLIPKF